MHKVSLSWFAFPVTNVPFSCGGGVNNSFVIARPTSKTENNNNNKQKINRSPR